MINRSDIDLAEVGRQILLPSTFIGGPRDTQQRYLDAMAVVQHYGKADIFLTMTCNHHWKEITDHLLPGQRAEDRPYLTARVFNAKLAALEDDILVQHCLGKVIHMHVIEFQLRGLPHAHILIILATGDQPTTVEDIDELIRAEIPDPELEPELYELVLCHMIHGPCGEFNMKCPCMVPVKKNDDRGPNYYKYFPKEL